MSSSSPSASSRSSPSSGKSIIAGWDTAVIVVDPIVTVCLPDNTPLSSVTYQITLVTNCANYPKTVVQLTPNTLLIGWYRNCGLLIPLVTRIVAENEQGYTNKYFLNKFKRGVRIKRQQQRLGQKNSWLIYFSSVSKSMLTVANRWGKSMEVQFKELLELNK